MIASQHIHGNKNGGWLNTGIFLEKGTSFAIIASGEVTLASLSNNIYTPEGKKGSSYKNTSNYPTYGNVIYKIGENGTLYKASSKEKVIAKESGTLYLSIYETVYNQNNKGAYVVRVNVEK